MNNVIDRLNQITEETTKDLVDSAYLAQQQNAQLVQSWFNILNANQQATRNLTVKMVQQAQEAQNLWFQLGQDLVRANADAFAQVSQAQFKNVNETIDNVSRQVKNGTRAAENATSTATGTAGSKTGAAK